MYGVCMMRQSLSLIQESRPSIREEVVLTGPFQVRLSCGDLPIARPETSRLSVDPATPGFNGDVGHHPRALVGFTPVVVVPRNFEGVLVLKSVVLN